MDYEPVVIGARDRPASQVAESGEVAVPNSPDRAGVDHSLLDAHSSANSCATAQPVYDPMYAMEYTLDLSGTKSPASADPYAAVKELVLKVFSRNMTGPHKYTLEVSELKGGITNMLLRGVYAATPSSASNRAPVVDERRFLVRAYGNGTGAIIDRDREFATHLSLYSLSLAPPLYSRFANGLIYGFIPGRTTLYTELSHPEIMRAVSNRLAEWHSKLDHGVIDNQIVDTKRRAGVSAPSFPRDVWQLMDKWIETMPSGVLDVTAADLKKELTWIKATIGETSPVVVSHCDLLSGNILVSEDWTPSPDASVHNVARSSGPYVPSQLVEFIDYEYAMPAPRAFDIANHFMEWQGFDCKTELIPTPSPSNPVLRFWALHYLSAFNHFEGKSVSRPSEHDIDTLIHELVSWWGMPGFYWGIWAAIQSSISDIDFDYAPYARSRMAEYFAWKRDLYSSQH